jgi:pilus assembly protein Flp/PilA
VPSGHGERAGRLLSVERAAKMLNVFAFLQNFFALRRDDRGATAVEYGLIVALVAVAIIIAVGALGTSLSGLFTTVSNDVGKAIGAA